MRNIIPCEHAKIAIASLVEMGEVVSETLGQKRKRLAMRSVQGLHAITVSCEGLRISIDEAYKLLGRVNWVKCVVVEDDKTLVVHYKAKCGLERIKQNVFNCLVQYIR